MAKDQHIGGSPFDRLPNEVVLKILSKACESKKAWAWGLPHMEDSGAWVSSQLLARLSLVCQRFYHLNTLAGASHVLWEFEKADSLMGVFMSSHVGVHLQSLSLHYQRAYRAEARKLQAVPSVEFLAAILRQCPNLSTFALFGNGTSQTVKASDHLQRVLLKLPLKTLYLVNAGFSFQEPLKSTSTWRNMRECKIYGASICDQFLHSLLEHLPALETLRVESCAGLAQPHLRSSSLKKLVLFLSVSSGQMVIDAPNLLSLKGVPELDRLDIYSPKVKRIILNGPVDQIQVLRNCKFSPSKLEVRGRDWRVDHIRKLLDTFGPSEKLMLEMEDFHSDCEPCGASTFLQKVSPLISFLHLGIMCTQLYETVACEKILQTMKFNVLMDVQITITQREDFSLLPLVMSCCPKVQRLEVGMRYLEKPIDLLATRVTTLQRAFPDVEIKYEEPAQFLSSAHVEDLALAENPEETLNTLAAELREFADQCYEEPI